MTLNHRWIFEAPAAHERAETGQRVYEAELGGAETSFAWELETGTHYAPTWESGRQPPRRPARKPAGVANVFRVTRSRTPNPRTTRSRTPNPRAQPSHSGRGKPSESARKSFNSLQPGYARRLGVGKSGQVHHAIELQVLDKFPGVFTERQLNAFSNMRGIPGEMSDALYQQRLTQLVARLKQQGLKPGTPQYKAHIRRFHDAIDAGSLKRKQLHNSKIRTLWNQHYARLKREIDDRGLKPGTPRYNAFVRQSLQQGRDYIDWALGQFFAEYRKAQDWTPGAPK